jgi:hypothetical protein
MNDLHLKSLLFRHFTARGWLSFYEIPVFHRGGPREEKQAITDVDVLALRPSENLRWEIVLGDCKTLKNQSAANRALWMKGLVDRMNATEGFVLLRRRLPISLDHKLFAAESGITLLSEEEWPVFDRAMIYPRGSDVRSEDASFSRTLQEVFRSEPGLKAAASYVYGGVWNDDNLVETLRGILAAARGVARELDPRRQNHVAVALEVAAIFSVAVAACVGSIFQQYVHPEAKRDLEEALRLLIWGGKSRYQFLASLRERLITAEGKESNGDSLVLPEWQRFVQLIRSLLESPRLAFRLPMIIRGEALHLLGAARGIRITGSASLLGLKHAFLLIGYMSRAAQFPSELTLSLEERFVKLQTEALERLKSGRDESRRSTDIDQLELGLQIKNRS